MQCGSSSWCEGLCFSRAHTLLSATPYIYSYIKIYLQLTEDAPAHPSCISKVVFYSKKNELQDTRFSFYLSRASAKFALKTNTRCLNSHERDKALERGCFRQDVA